MECKTTGKDIGTKKEEERSGGPAKGIKRVKHKIVLA